jgi:hypothetical protein
MTSAGLPHSGIDGALPACGPPSLFAACHALHRPVSPRHPPHTGSCLRTTVLAARQNSDHVPRDLGHRSLFNCQGATPCGAPIIISVRQTQGKAYTTLPPSRRRTADRQIREDAIIGRKGFLPLSSVPRHAQREGDAGLNATSAYLPGSHRSSRRPLDCGHRRDRQPLHLPHAAPGLWAQGRSPADPMCPGVRDMGELQPPGKPGLSAVR